MSDFTPHLYGVQKLVSCNPATLIILSYLGDTAKDLFHFKSSSLPVNGNKTHLNQFLLSSLVSFHLPRYLFSSFL